MTDAPSRANASAVARPMPELAPVMRATLRANRFDVAGSDPGLPLVVSDIYR
jgi:hypothetical protein